LASSTLGVLPSAIVTVTLPQGLVSERSPGSASVKGAPGEIGPVRFEANDMHTLEFCGNRTAMKRASRFEVVTSHH
jgi:hypothetical protein